MDRKKIASELIKKLNREEILALIKKLEQDGIPVQISVRVRVDTPGSLVVPDGFSENTAYTHFGDHYERAVNVKRIANLEQKYEPDVILLEGDHDSLKKLRERIDELNVFHQLPQKGTSAKNVCQMIRDEFGKDPIVPLYNILYDPDPEKEGYDIHGNEISGSPWCLLPRTQVYDFLTSKGITFLRYNIVAEPSGMYDNGDCITALNMTKVADISLKLI